MLTMCFDNNLETKLHLNAMQPQTFKHVRGSWKEGEGEWALG